MGTVKSDKPIKRALLLLVTLLNLECLLFISFKNAKIILVKTWNLCYVKIMIKYR